MDLRQRLLARLGLLLGGLLGVALLVQLHSLAADIEAEVAASARLVEVLLAADSDDRHFDARLATAGLRHLRIRTAEQSPVASEVHPLSAAFGLSPAAASEREIRIGNRQLYIAPHPGSEIEERLGDTVRLLITLLLYSGATLLVAWWATDRALRPVRDLEDGLQRLANGEEDPALPAFALREFSRVACAIDRLAAALADGRNAQRALARQLIAVQEEERRTLARELHDDMGQTLTAINVTAAHLERNAARLDAASVAECAADLRRDIRHCGERLRDMLKTLRPHGLDAAGLATTLDELIAGWRQKATGIEFAVDFPQRLPACDDICALTLYRVVQEALTNVVRHSGARHCIVRLGAAADDMTVVIEDDGHGLPQAAPARRGGLLGMAERLDMVGGSMALDGSQDGGLRLTARIPVRCRDQGQTQGGGE